MPFHRLHFSGFYLHTYRSFHTLCKSNGIFFCFLFYEQLANQWIFLDEKYNDFRPEPLLSWKLDYEYDKKEFALTKIDDITKNLSAAYSKSENSNPSSSSGWIIMCHIVPSNEKTLTFLPCVIFPSTKVQRHFRHSATVRWTLYSTSLKITRRFSFCSLFFFLILSSFCSIGANICTFAIKFNLIKSIFRIFQFFKFTQREKENERESNMNCSQEHLFTV